MILNGFPSLVLTRVTRVTTVRLNKYIYRARMLIGGGSFILNSPHLKNYHNDVVKELHHKFRAMGSFPCFVFPLRISFHHVLEINLIEAKKYPKISKMFALLLKLNLSVLLKELMTTSGISYLQHHHYKN